MNSIEKNESREQDSYLLKNKHNHAKGKADYAKLEWI